MQYLSIDYLVVYAFLGITLILGFRAGKGIKDIREYALANRTFGTVALTLSYLATDIAAITILGGVEDIFSDGIIYFIANLAPLVSYSIMALVVVPHMIHFQNCMTLGDIMKSLYGTYSGIITGILSILINYCLLGVDLYMFGVICESILSINARWGMVLGGLMLAAYSAYGGVKSVTVTDIFQFIVFIVGIPLISYLVINRAGGIEGIFTQVPMPRLQVVGHEKFYFYLPLFIIGAFLPVAVASPVMMQRVLMAQHPKQLRDQFFIAGIFIPFLLCTLLIIGLGALVLYPNIAPNQVFAHIIHTLLPTGIKGLAMAAMLGIGMSLSSLMHNTGLTLVHDVIKPLCDQKNIAIDELRWTRWATALVGVTAIGLGITATNSWDLFLSALAFQIPTMVVPILASILGFKIDQRSFYTAFVVTIAVFIVTKVYLPEAYGHLGLPIQLLANGLTFFGMHYVQNNGFVMLQRTVNSKST